MSLYWPHSVCLLNPEDNSQNGLESQLIQSLKQMFLYLTRLCAFCWSQAIQTFGIMLSFKTKLPKCDIIDL